MISALGVGWKWPHAIFFGAAASFPFRRACLDVPQPLAFAAPFQLSRLTSYMPFEQQHRWQEATELPYSVLGSAKLLQWYVPYRITSRVPAPTAPQGHTRP